MICIWWFWSTGFADLYAEATYWWCMRRTCQISPSNM